MDINKTALEYLSEPIVKEALPIKKRRTRRALQSAYEKNREKYLFEKSIVDQTREEGLALQKKFEHHKKNMDKYHQEMNDLRTKLNKMDDNGERFIEIEYPNPEDIEEFPETEEATESEEEIENLPE